MTAPLRLALSIFEKLARETADPPGVTRATFSAEEALAHRVIAEAARDMDLAVTHDAAGNQYMTWPGRDRAAPRILIGSHMDSVPHGGNYDGVAGVAMGLALIRALKDEDFVPAQDIVVMAIRAEELVWFPTPYCGSRMAFGLLDAGDYDAVRRSDTGRSLADHMAAEGFDPDALKSGARPLDPATIRFFIEPHIEQGPFLIGRDMPVGIVTGIRGNLRYRHSRITGVYNHAGAVPRDFRSDALFAGAELVSALDALWDRYEDEGLDFVATVGQFHTDATHHAMTKIPGDVRFTMDIRSLDNDLLMETDTRLRETAAEIARRRRVDIDLGPYTNAPPAILSSTLRQSFADAAKAAGVPALDMPSGAGHDCATFAWQGVDAGMLFIRNANGSHNPDEAMDLDDFAAALRVLTACIKALG